MHESLRFPDANGERINNPGNPNHYWRFRMHLNIEDLLEQTGFNQFVRDQLNATGRLEVY